MATIEVFAPAKINLTLHVTGQREDGYHELDSLVVFAKDVGDKLRVEASEELSLDVTGPLSAGVPTDDSNLVLKAARLLQETHGVRQGARLTLEKLLPNGGGIGGGSADAAAALSALARLWNVKPLPPEKALSLGADVPVCVAGPKPARMRGIGEILQPVPGLPPIWLVLVNPGLHVSTPRVFALLDRLYDGGTPEMERMPPEWDFEEFHVWLLGQVNDLTKCAREDADGIGDVLDVLREQAGCKDADMSGSGSTCWGLFQTADAAQASAERIAAEHPEWWVRATAVS